MNIKNRVCIKYSSIFFVVIIILLYGLLMYSTRQLRIAGELHTYAKPREIFFTKVCRHLPFSQFITNESELDSILAYHVLRQGEADYVKMMSQAGVALKIFQEVEEKNDGNNQEVANNALLEISTILIRMPWSEKIKNLSVKYIDKLHLSILNNSIEIDDMATAHENLAIYFSRINLQDRANYHASMADSIDEQQYEPTISQAFVFLRHQRMALGACISGSISDIDWDVKSTFDKKKIVTQQFLRNQYYQFWDVAFVKTVMLTSKEDSCRNLAKNYQNLLK